MAAPRTLAGVVPKIASKAMARRGLAFGPLIADWPSIVGPAVADRAVPFKLVFPQGSRRDATLHLRVSGAAALELQHREAQVVDRINSFFGYAAVARLRLVQAPPAIERRARPVLQPDRARLAALESRLEKVADPELKERLRSFAEAMASRPRR